MVGLCTLFSRQQLNFEYLPSEVINSNYLCCNFKIFLFKIFFLKPSFINFWLARLSIHKLTKGFLQLEICGVLVCLASRALPYQDVTTDPTHFEFICERENSTMDSNSNPKIRRLQESRQMSDRSCVSFQ